MEYHIPLQRLKSQVSLNVISPLVVRFPHTREIISYFYFFVSYLSFLSSTAVQSTETEVREAVNRGGLVGKRDILGQGQERPLRSRVL